MTGDVPRAQPDQLPRLLAGLRPDGRPLSLEEHLAVHGALPRFAGTGPDRALIELVRRSGLRGRGGAGFPTGVKLASVANGHGRPVVVANGAEGEPMSIKDRILLDRVPHLVLDGAVTAAHAVGARDVVVAVPATSVHGVKAAVYERTARGHDAITPVVVVVPDRFVAGEESALVSLLNGGPGLPTFVPPRPYEKGVAQRPTLVSNVETLAHLGLIARHGAEWFRTLGTPEEPGSTLVSAGGALRKPGVIE
ncbi:MAG: NADH-ubiquinone oxidoreductase-F iron-sulfur binding region domain-containing protein, partial [Acidimicrobiales bacterium]